LPFYEQLFIIEFNQADAFLIESEKGLRKREEMSREKKIKYHHKRRKKQQQQLKR
jgi:hypothetical protein